LVTGGAGFIGSHLTDSLVRRGAQVRVLDDLSTGREENLEAAIATGQVELTVGSVRDVPLFGTLMSGCSHVFHLAASVGVGSVTTDPLGCLENNVEGVQALFRAAHAQSRFPRILLFSSSEVYGKSVEIPLHEESTFQLGPARVSRWSYAACKVLAEYHALAEYETHSMPVTIVRCFNTSGPRQLPTYGMVIPRFFEQALKGDPITVYGDGAQTRCFSYVLDVVEGVLGLADHDETAGEVYNIGSNQETSVLELAQKIRALTGSVSAIRHVPFDEVFGGSFQEVPRRVPDLTKIDALLGADLRQTELTTLLQSIHEDYRSNGRSFDGQSKSERPDRTEGDAGGPTGSRSSSSSSSSSSSAGLQAPARIGR